MVELCIRAVAVPEGQRHMVNGTADCARNQGAAIARQMLAVADGLGEGCKEIGTPLWEDVVEELIVAVLDVIDCFQRFHT